MKIPIPESTLRRFFSQQLDGVGEEKERLKATEWVLNDSANSAAADDLLLAGKRDAVTIETTMKRLASSFGLAVLLCCSANGSTNVTLSVGNADFVDFTVPTGQVARVVYADLHGSAFIASTDLPGGFSINSGEAKTNARLPVVVGPLTIRVGGGITGSSAMCTIELSSPADTFTPNTAVVIPADSNGPVNIILESSTDLVNWTAALPGTYGTSTSKRFFRVRAERTP